MAGLRVHFVMPPELVARIDAARGELSRGEFVRRAVERALGECGETEAAGIGSSRGGRAVSERALLAPPSVSPDPVTPAPAEQPDVNEQLRASAEELVGREVPEGESVVPWKSGVERADAFRRATQKP